MFWLTGSSLVRSSGGSLNNIVFAAVWLVALKHLSAIHKDCISVLRTSLFPGYCVNFSVPCKNSA